MFILLLSGLTLRAWLGPDGSLSVSTPAYDVEHYRIDLAIDPQRKWIEGQVTVAVRFLKPATSLQLDLVEGYRVEMIEDEFGRPIRFSRTSHALNLDFSQPYDSSARHSFTIHYAGQPPEAKNPPWSGGFLWRKDPAGKDWVTLTCQQEGAMMWIPCKNTLGDEAESVDLILTVPEGLYCAGIGHLVGLTKVPKGWRFHWRTAYPINTYNINFVMGDFALLERPLSAEDGSHFPARVYIQKDRLEFGRQILDTAVDYLHTLEGLFGPYPFPKDKFAVVYVPYSAMEHQTLIAYGKSFKAEEVHGFPFRSTLLHEIAHEWWGNMISVGDWADFWLQEGFATYAEALFLEVKAGDLGYHHWMALLRKDILNQQPLMLQRNATSSQAYHLDIYNKAAYLLHSLRYAMGKDAFFAMLGHLGRDPAWRLGRPLQFQDFMDLLDRFSELDLKPFVMFFLTQTEPLQVHIQQVKSHRWQITLSNLEGKVPMEVQSGRGTERLLLGGEGHIVDSQFAPLPDPQHWFLREIKLEPLGSHHP